MTSQNCNIFVKKYFALAPQSHEFVIKGSYFDNRNLIQIVASIYSCGLEGTNTLFFGNAYMSDSVAEDNTIEGKSEFASVFQFTLEGPHN